MIKIKIPKFLPKISLIYDKNINIFGLTVYLKYEKKLLTKEEKIKELFVKNKIKQEKRKIKEDKDKKIKKKRKTKKRKRNNKIVKKIKKRKVQKENNRKRKYENDIKEIPKNRKRRVFVPKRKISHKRKIDNESISLNINKKKFKN